MELHCTLHMVYCFIIWFSCHQNRISKNFYFHKTNFKKKSKILLFKIHNYRGVGGNNNESPSIKAITLLLKFFHSSTASSSIFSWSWATARSRAQRCQTVVMDLPMVALLASFPVVSSCEALPSRATIFSWKELTTATNA